MKAILRGVHPHKSEFEPTSLIPSVEPVVSLESLATHTLELIYLDNPNRVSFKKIVLSDTTPNMGDIVLVDSLKPVSDYLILDKESNIVEVSNLDMFSAEYRDAVKVYPMNMVGVPGKGLAKYWSMKYPHLVHQYKTACRKKTFHAKHLLYLEDCLLVPTKEHWKNPSTIGFVDRTIEGIKEFILMDQLNPDPITHMVIPKLGCGVKTGQLNYHDEVKPRLLDYLSGLPLKIIIEE